MSPSSSARGTNSDGGTEPSSALFQRRRASAAVTVRESSSMSGW